MGETSDRRGPGPVQVIVQRGNADALLVGKGPLAQSRNLVAFAYIPITIGTHIVQFGRKLFYNHNAKQDAHDLQAKGYCIKISDWAKSYTGLGKNNDLADVLLRELGSNVSFDISKKQTVADKIAPRITTNEINRQLALEKQNGAFKKLTSSFHLEAVTRGTLKVEVLPSKTEVLDWTKELEMLESFFDKETPRNQLLLNTCAKVNNTSKMIRSHLDMVKANNGNPAYLPYLERLRILKEQLIN